jgi:broad specificity phosphatase PhoE
VGNIDEQIYASTPTSDLKLTEKGKQQAEAAGREIVAKIGGGRVAMYCSSFLRACETMDKVKEVLEKDSKIEVSNPIYKDEITEQKYGNQAGLATIEIEKKKREQYGHYYYKFPDGEFVAAMYVSDE